MEGMYPSLHEKFKNEGICPICMMAMGAGPKYSCDNHHTVCHRCKPYYYACPTCRSPLNLEFPSAEAESHYGPPPTHYMPHPYSPYDPQGFNPSAPFIDEERHSWVPPTPSEDEDLKHCGFCHAGCEARFPEHLRQLHESRCQFRPNLEEEQLPTDLSHDEDTLVNCRYTVAGCNVRLSEWRKRIHEETCIYKDGVATLDGMIDCLDELSFDDDPEEMMECRFRPYGCMVKMPRRRKSIHEEKCNYLTCEDPEEMVECRFRTFGCMVRMPRRRKSIHEQKCNYSKYYEEEEEEEKDEFVPDEDPDQQVPCMWAEYGCQVTPRLCRKYTHEEKCNYRMEHCSYRERGCEAMFPLPKKYVHERNCEYA